MMRSNTFSKIVASFAVLALSIQPATTLAMSAETARGVANDAPWVSKVETCTASGSSEGSPSALKALENVPTVWRDLISKAAPLHKESDPRMVAVALWVENRGYPEFKKTGWASSSVGAQGPWQFMPATWAGMGYDGNGDGKKDPNDPEDAVHAAFEHFRNSAGKPIANTGYDSKQSAEANFASTSFERNSNNLLSYASAYNGSKRSAPADGTKLNAFPRKQNADYIIMAYWLLATDLKQGYIFEQGLVDAQTKGAAANQPATTPTQIGQTDSCASLSGSGNVNTEGYSWPVAPQTKEKNSKISGLSAVPCPSTTCHHDQTAAFDLGVQPGGDAQVGTPVYAITDSEVVSLSDGYAGQPGCASIEIRGNTEKDNFFYAYLHIQQPKVIKGQQVKAGTQLAVIGDRRCTGNGSTPHLHIDRGCIRNGEPQHGGSDSCRDPKFIDLINKLFSELPEK